MTDQVSAPLLAQGYTDSLLDGLDALQRDAPDAASAAAALVQALHARAPQTRLLAGGAAWLETFTPQLPGVVATGLVRERAGEEGL